MSQDLFVITGATGNIGSKLVDDLLAAGKKVRAVARSRDKLNRLAAKGAEAFEADVADADALTRAFTGARAVFLLIPPNYGAPDFRKYQNEVSEAYATALQRSKVPYVVNLSSIGAHLGNGAGVVDGLYDHEQRLNRLSGVNILHLRPTFFLENLFFSVGTIKQMGLNGTPFRPDVKMGMIATQDIAAEAAERLKKLDFKGASVKELLGQRDVSMAEATGIIGHAIGQNDLRYVQFPYEEAEKSLVGMGMSPDTARRMVQLYRGTNEGIVKPTQPRSAANTTRTRIEDFVAAALAPAFKGN